jgi:hypothetical protein
VVDRAEIAMSDNSLSGDESVYRRIPDDRNWVNPQPGGTFKISGQAFWERSQRISVDRVLLCPNGPWHLLESYPGPAGVVSITVEEIHTIDDLTHKDKVSSLIQTFEVDVEAAPIINDPDIPDNPAHAEICTKPKCPKRVFEVFIERLALLANNKWVIEPPSIRNIP